MKKNVFLVIGLFLLLCFNANAQRNECSEDHMWRYCDYEEAFLWLEQYKTSSPIRLSNGLEVGYDKTRDVYSIFVKTPDGSRMNMDVKYKKCDDKGYYCYEGIDRISEVEVVVSCKSKLSLYTKNHGVTSDKVNLEEDAIILSFPRNKFYIVPTK